MIKGLTCRHCLKGCLEAWREMTCSDFQPNWQAIIADEDIAISRQGKAEYRRICRRARKEAAEK